MRTLTLQDVADLANVRRPVVTMWRNRPRVRGESVPFPAAVSRAGGIERFRAGEVVDYLKRTGRGNNVDIEFDVDAVAVPDGVDLEDLVVLLTWHALTGLQLAGTTPAERSEQAEEYDPDDGCVLRELQVMDPPAATLEYVDQLVEASFGLPDALARIERSRLQRELGIRELAAGAVGLLARVIAECAVFLEPEDLALRVDGSPTSLAVAGECGLPVISDSRAVLRRAVISGTATGQSHDRHLVYVSAVGLPAADAIDTADDLVLGLEPGRIGVLVGPASALTDTLAGELQRRRADVLRVGSVVAAVRLPRGLWREAHRQHLALWVCRGGADEHRPCVTDLAAIAEPDLADFAADIAAGLAQTEARAFRYARRIDRAGVLAGGPLVPRGVRAVTLSSVDHGRHVERVHAITLTTTAPLQPVDVLVEPAVGRLRLRQRSLGELHDDGKLMLRRGNRIDRGHAVPGGTVRLMPVEGKGAMDPVDAEHLYPRAARTEPGDVVFVERPRPQAWVDMVGGAMVVSPARILRLSRGADFGPRVLATAINETAAAGSEWPTWTVPEMSADDASKLEMALGQIEQYEAEVQRRIAAASDLKKALIDGVAAGALNLDASPTTPGVAGADK